ncbi:capsid assembly scaffolding protein Gp46 family protein [Actinomyces howellii]|uniref:Scaffolding protein n=1 Tax=Actinomyces howellii TaxID=52771 RepID=A0A3S4RWH7_9ACTO|nr:DUF4355 domain-containing protein [Actinomyces howellii]VEG28038.1 Uncharacterised protein [Actinomyces howellii]
MRISTMPRHARFAVAPDPDPAAGTTPSPDPGSGDGSKPAWTPPASQEELDRIIGERLARERAKFSDYDALKTKAAAFDQAAEASKTAEERAADRLAKAEARATEAEARAAQAEAAAMRAEVAATKGVPVGFLTGATREEADKAADELLAWKNGPTTTTNGGLAGPLGPGARRARGSGSTGGVKGGGLEAGREAFKAAHSRKGD